MKSSLISRLISLSTIVANLLELDIVESTYIDAHVSGKTESAGDPILMDASMYDAGVKCLGDDGVWSIYCADRDAYRKVAFFTFAEKTTEPRRFTVLSDFNTQSCNITVTGGGQYVWVIADGGFMPHPEGLEAAIQIECDPLAPPPSTSTLWPRDSGITSV